MNRRDVLKIGGTALGLTALGMPAAHAARASRAVPAANGARLISFVNTHTGDTFADAYWENGAYVPDAMNAIKHVMRDHRSGEEHDIDPRLLDQLTDLRGAVGASQPYQIISGYRAPATNAAMHELSTGVATRSLHMEGRAIDIRVSGVDLTRLRDAAIGLQRGGVGFYPGAANNFIHVDTGRVRRW